MQHARMTVALFTFVAMSRAVAAQEAQKAALPDTTPCPEAIAAIATCYAAKHETGAYITAALPKTWNGNLVVFAHGEPSLLPPTATGSKSDLNKYSYAVQRGFAWVASSYRREGYGVAMAAADSDNARKFFIARIGKPQHSLLHGASYGGLVGAKLIETYAKNPDGSLKAAGGADHLVQAFTDERGHTAQSAPELAAGLDALMQWIEKGTKPTAQSIAAGCQQLRASFDGPCRYHPEYTPKPYATRYYTREAAVR